MPQGSKNQMEGAGYHAYSPNSSRSPPTRYCKRPPFPGPLQQTLLTYAFDDIVNAINEAASVLADPSIFTGATAMMLLHALANDATDEFGLPHNELFCRSKDTNVLHVRRTAKGGRHGGSRSAILFGRFSSVKAGKRVEVVPWNVAIDDDVRTGLLSYLSRIKKKQATE